MRHTSTLSRWALFMAILALPFALGTGCDDDGGGFERSQTGELLLTPDSVLLPKAAIGQPVTRNVQVENVGRAPVTLININARFSSDEFEVRWTDQDGNDQPGIRGGTNDFPGSIEIAPQSFIELVVIYIPADEGNDDGSISFESNAPNALEVTIPVASGDARPEISVSPLSYDFERVPALDTGRGDIVVTNIGQVALELSNITINGSQDFTPLLDNRDPRRDPDILADPDRDGEPGIAPGESVTIVVEYAPPVEGPDSGELSILSNDPISPEVKVQLTANGSTSCLDVVPEALEFPTSLINRTDTRSLTLESCGTTPLEFTSIELAENSDPAFELDVESVTQNIGELPGATLPAVGPNGERAARSIRINFSPTEEKIYNGTLLVTTNDPINPVKEVSLLGRGLTNACPEARPLVNEFYVNPLDGVVFDGTPSIDVDGPNNKPVEYIWEVVAFSGAAPPTVLERFINPSNPGEGGPIDDTSTPTAVFWVAAAGTYTFKLVVVDDQGTTSEQCRTSALVQVIAIPPDDLLAELTWITENDQDPTDREGTDMDLHLLHPDGVLNSPDGAYPWGGLYDIHYLRLTSDWGIPNNPEDDPYLDLDDDDGAGPERIRLNDPELTDPINAEYIVGVHYFNDMDMITGAPFGPSDARLRIFIKGELAWDYDGNTKTIERRCEMWEAASIRWLGGDGEVTTVDTMSRWAPPIGTLDCDAPLPDPEPDPDPDMGMGEADMGMEEADMGMEEADMGVMEDAEVPEP